MKFGSWTYKLDALNIKVNKTDQPTPKATTGEADDGFSEGLFEKNGVNILINTICMIIMNNSFKILKSTFYLGVGNTRCACDSNRNFFSLQQSSRNLCGRNVHYHDEEENTLLFFISYSTVCLDR